MTVSSWFPDASSTPNGFWVPARAIWKCEGIAPESSDQHRTPVQRGKQPHCVRRWKWSPGLNLLFSFPIMWLSYSWAYHQCQFLSYFTHLFLAMFSLVLSFHSCLRDLGAVIYIFTTLFYCIRSDPFFQPI